MSNREYWFQIVFGILLIIISLIVGVYRIFNPGGMFPTWFWFLSSAIMVIAIISVYLQKKCNIEERNIEAEFYSKRYEIHRRKLYDEAYKQGRFDEWVDWEYGFGRYKK